MKAICMSNRWYSSAFITLAVMAVLAGCSVGPAYRQPQPAMPESWSGGGPGVTTNAPAQLAQWWKTLGDEQLDSLIERAVRSNNDLKAAEARVRAARALRGVAAADFLPTIGSSASYNTARRSRNAMSSPNALVDTDTYQAGFDASWEIDIFGGKRRALQAASADLQAIQEDRRAVLVSLLAEVARNYIEYRGAQLRLSIARQNIQAQQETVDITQMRFDKGLAGELELTQARALLASTQSQVPPLESALKQSSHRLAVLLGLQPDALETELAAAAPIPRTPPEVPAGLPSDLLLRRPDVRRAERQLASATARIGVAKAELFPKFYLTGAAGYQSFEAGNLIEPASKMWSAGPSVRWRLLEFPRLSAQIKAQTAQQEQVLLQFQQIVLLSLEDVENALVAYDKEKERYRALRESAESSKRSVELSNELYLKGVGDFLTVLVNQRALYATQDALAQSERATTQNLVALYKALGGGWEPSSTSK